MWAKMEIFLLDEKKIYICIYIYIQIKKGKKKQGLKYKLTAIDEIGNIRTAITPLKKKLIPNGKQMETP